MAFNWDKLCKAQREFAKPKYALDAISRHLKKRPNDPYVLAWRASTLLLQDHPRHDIQVILDGLWTRHPPITDLNLLSFLYQLSSTANRPRGDRTLAITSVGDLPLKSWQNAAKSFPNRNARLALWSELFVSAMREDCWDDVRFAILQANKEGHNSKRNAYYSLILANQLAAERQIKNSKQSGKNDPGSQLKLTLALRQMKEAYDNSPKPTDNEIQMQDLRDLQFMASIYSRQDRSMELIGLWSQAPPHLKQIMAKHPFTIMNLQVKAAQKERQWATLERLTLSAILPALEAAEQSDIQPLLDVCGTVWSIWRGFLEATMNLYPAAEAVERIDKIRSRFVDLLPRVRGQGVDKGRAIALTHIALSEYSRKSLLSQCQEYWLDHVELPSCFSDLRRTVAQLPVEEQQNLLEFMKNRSDFLRPHDDNVPKEDVKRWLRVECSMLMFEHLVRIARPKSVPDLAIEDFVVLALRLHKIASLADEVHPDVVYLAISGLLKLGHSGSLWRLQAALFARHCLSDVRFRNVRPLALISTRLHLRFCQCATAFQHYGYAKVKEMLHDTVSYILLTRISQIQPFGVSGRKGFSADDELAKVVDNIKRMEARTDDLLYKGLQDFQYDKAIDLLELKRKLRSSLTKHCCMVERRRIARFRSEPVDRTLDLDMKDSIDIYDNHDENMIPNLGPFEDNHVWMELLDCAPINPKGLAVHRNWCELPQKVAFSEPIDEGFTRPTWSMWTETEQLGDSSGGTQWTSAHFFDGYTSAQEIAIHLEPHLKSNYTCEKSLSDALAGALDRLKFLNKATIEWLNRAESPSYNRFLVQENLIVPWYNHLELLRTFARFADMLSNIVRTKSSPVYYPDLKRANEELRLVVKESYDNIRKGVQAQLDWQQERGATWLKQQLVSGRAGAMLKEIIPAEDIEFYARDYMESSRETLMGVLKVKLV